jgi:methylenetetrahydrofolate dehydrogenase (NADP+)/methenyltetrahydrofolate cyclohydrolase
VPQILGVTVLGRNEKYKSKDLAISRNSTGIIVQLPVPRHITQRAVLDAVPPLKDVDGLTSFNSLRLLIGHSSETAGPRFIPCAPDAVLRLLDSANVSLQDKFGTVQVFFYVYSGHSRHLMPV